jgi:hypothetical protein
VFGVTGGFVALVTGFSAGLARWLRPPTAPSPPPPLPSTPLIIFNKVPPPPVPPAIRRARLVLDRHGGPLLAVLLAGNGFLYAERVYLVAAGKAPVLRSVLAGYDGKVGFAATTRAALADLAAGAWSRP